MSEQKLKPHQVTTLKYYWEDRNDLERWAEFEGLKPQIEKEYPQLLKAWNDYKISVAIMDAVIKSLPE